MPWDLLVSLAVVAGAVWLVTRVLLRRGSFRRRTPPLEVEEVTGLMLAEMLLNGQSGSPDRKVRWSMTAQHTLTVLTVSMGNETQRDRVYMALCLCNRGVQISLERTPAGRPALATVHAVAAHAEQAEVSLLELEQMRSAATMAALLGQKPNNDGRLEIVARLAAM